MRTKTPTAITSRLQFRWSRRIAGTTGAVLGTCMGVALVALATVAGAHQSVGADAKAVFDVTHLPPLLTIPGEPVELRYDVHCLPAGMDVDAKPCDVRGTVFVRRGSLGAYRAFPLQVDETANEGRYVAVLPRDITSSSAGFSYYAVLESDAAHLVMTLPAAGTRSPQHSMPLGRSVDVSLGAHMFGAPDQANARVFSAAWGDGPTDVGLEDGRNLPPAGGSSFDIDVGGNVHVLDQVHRRVLGRAADGSEATTVPVGIDGTIADIAVEPSGTTYVLETERADHRPVLRAFTESGEAQGTVEIGERTASEVRIGPDGPIVLQQPSSQWVPVVVNGQSASASMQAAAGQPGRTFRGGSKVIVLRRGSEIRALAISANGTRRAWRITSATPLAEVQLAQPMGSRLFLVVRVYTDSRDEFVALVLGSEGLIQELSFNSADWAETAPLSRFRVVGPSVYQLGSTPTGIFVDRYDLDVG